jgi:site-specific recombinase XerD
VASIRERHSDTLGTTYAVLWRHGKKQRSRTFESHDAAVKFKTLIEILGPDKAIQTLRAEVDTGLTVDQLAERFFEWKVGNIEPRTMTDYRRDYKNWIKPHLGHRAADSVDEMDVQAVVDRWRKSLSPKSVADRHMLLHSMFKFGASRTRGLVKRNPCTETDLPKRDKRVLKGATLAEWLALRAAAREVEPDACDLMEFIAATGWRWSEAASLAVRDVEEWETNGRMTMRATMAQVFRKDGEYKQVLATDDAKSQAGLRTVKVPAHAAAMVRRRLVGKGPDDLVFTNAAGRKWYQQNFLSRTWKRIEASADLDRHLTPHAIRHLHVALLDRSGASLAEMKRRLGHEDIQTTINVYGGMIDDVSDDVLAKLDALLEPSDDTVAGEVVAGSVVLELD